VKGAGTVLAVLFAVNLLNFYDRVAPGALAEPLRREFSLSDAQLGGLSTAFTLVYAVAGLPLGRLADRGSRKGLLAAGLALWSAMTALGAFAAGYFTLAASRLGVAVGEAACAPAATSWIGDLYPPERRARPLARFMLAVPIGVALSFVLTGAVAQAFGWRAALVAAAAPAVFLLPALLLLPEPPRAASGGHSHATAISLLRIPAFRWIVVSGAALNFVMYVVSTFLPAFLSRWHGAGVAAAGWWSGVAHLGGGLAGGVLAGWMGDRFPNRRLAAAALAAAAAAPLTFAAPLQPRGSIVAAIVLIAAGYGLLNMYYGLVYAALQDVVAPDRRGAAMALYFMAMYLCGASFGPLLTGRLSDHLAQAAAGGRPMNELFRAAGLQQAMFVVPVLCLALAAVLYAGSRAAGARANLPGSPAPCPTGPCA
jgi:MFS family permease